MILKQKIDGEGWRYCSINFLHSLGEKCLREISIQGKSMLVI